MDDRLDCALKPRVNSMNILLVGLLAAALWLGLGAGAGAEKLPSLGERSGSPIITSQARQLGDEFMREARRQLVFVSDPLLLAYVRALGSRVSASVDDDSDVFKFHLVRSGEVNAFAVPGGHVLDGIVESPGLALLRSMADSATEVGSPERQGAPLRLKTLEAINEATVPR